MMLTPDMRALIDVAQLCFAATVTPDGRPNLSPKGTIRVWDDEHLFFLDIASPQTRANLERSPWLELNVVDQLSRRGYRFAGSATLHYPGTTEYDDAVRRVYGGAPPSSPPSAAIMLAVQRAEPVLSPAYWRGLDEHAIRAHWRERRAAIDREFEAYLARVGPVRIEASE